MGFGPTAPDANHAIQAIREIVALLYPQYATLPALGVLENIARALLDAKIALSFTNIARFLADPEWRQGIIRQSPEVARQWQTYLGQSIPAERLDPDFAAFLSDRLSTNGPEGSDPF